MTMYGTSPIYYRLVSLGLMVVDRHLIQAKEILVLPSLLNISKVLPQISR